MRDWWIGRSPREQGLLGLLGALLAGFLVWFGLAAPLQGAARGAEARLTRALADEAVVDAAVAEIARLGERAPTRRSTPVEQLVAETAASAGLDVIRIEAADGDSVQAVVSGPSTAVLPWIALLQAEHAVAARHLTLLKGDVGQLDVDATFVGLVP
ncbi:MAG: type II secretion system protein GspM [Phenylobacterium sp.]|uniref:type II secretion system protein GspM n=1 Tax=Phenylobacterium sp. TaxID=1871053 RepID=UPI002735E77E|nr:type II secretion system protein GspM [Phenylobacterium sp.]MDP1643777.1 type II secretion system protein GspM [Phenylobacterium sp.]MDP3117833.1 type II secretion system protein GspM [Phenylobacterium sp.]